MKVIQPRRWEEIEAFYLHFDDLDEPGRGFTFPCDRSGVVVEVDDDLARANYEACLNGGHNVGRGYVVDRSRRWLTEEIRECDACGNHAIMSRSCGAFVCSSCGKHDGLARCFCGWSASGGDGYAEFVEMGETIEAD